jgi:transcriptional regulator with PAS, ATPase and Fis domain
MSSGEYDDFKDKNYSMKITSPVIVNSKVMQNLYKEAEKLASSEATILILGETGVGKSLLARFVHDHSHRRHKIFLPLNCSSISDTLLESELFGHAKGSFSGAIADRKGLFETASGGTIFLDDITNASPSTQMKLLEVLENLTIRSVGKDTSRIVDIRIICASNMKIKEEIECNRFRKDLFYRISTLVLEIPPLRERREEIIPLANFFLKKFKKKCKGFDQQTVDILLNYSWPGNVRELESAVHRATIISETEDYINADQFSYSVEDPKLISGDMSFKSIRCKFEKTLIQEALGNTGWNTSKTAKNLGISQRYLQMLIKKYTLIKPETCVIFWK